MASRATKASDREPLSAERIELAALEVIEREGLAAFSTRKLAAELRCEAMSIYHYFPSKEHLLDALVDRVIGSELTVLDPSAGPWRGQLEKSGAEWRAMALRHPHFFGYLALHRLNTPLALRWLNGVIGLLRSVGVGDERAVRMFRVMGYYLTGAMLDETQGYARGPSTVAPLSDEVMARDYPDVVAAGRWFQPDEWPGTYELGFRVFLDALERMVERRLL